jgi:hypothetical protein
MCTAIGCIDGLRIDVAKASPWPAGAYTFAFVLDGEKVTCAGALPLKACEAGPSLTCDVAGKVQVEESGCALEPAAHGWGAINVPARVTKLELSIAHEGQELRKVELAPTYKESRPNGPDCEPVCNSAAERVELP